MVHGSSSSSVWGHGSPHASPLCASLNQPLILLEPFSAPTDAAVNGGCMHGVLEGQGKPSKRQRIA